MVLRFHDSGLSKRSLFDECAWAICIFICSPLVLISFHHLFIFLSSLFFIILHLFFIHPSQSLIYLSIYLFIYLSIYLSIYLYLYEHLDLHVVLGVPVVGVVGAEGVVPLGGVAHLNTGDLRSLKYILK